MAEGSRHYDSIVIGSGQAGGPLSTALVSAGRKTALIEREHVGGTCINEGCTPTKTMVASARVAYLDARSRDYGVHTLGETVDMLAIRSRKRDIVNTFRNGSRKAIVDGGVDLIMGEACFASPGSVEVRRADEILRLSASNIFIDTGTRPSVPTVPGLDSVPFLDSTSIMELEEIPSHLLILGGGYVALEFGQMFRRFGSQVTIIEMSRRLIPREDQDVGQAVEDILREDGCNIILGAKLQRVHNFEGNAIQLEIQTPEELSRLEGSHLLVAVGRVPNTEHLDLEAAGVEMNDRGFVKVNERLETTAPGIYAMGDVVGHPQFTHISYDDFRILRTNLLEGGNRTSTDRLVPYTVFIDPQLGRVGLNEQDARKQGRNIRVARLSMSHVARALEVDESRGFVKVVVDPDTDEILGCSVLGLEGGEIMAMLEIAMMGKVRASTLREGIFAHPTLAELMNRLFENFDA